MVKILVLISVSFVIIYFYNNDSKRFVSSQITKVSNKISNTDNKEGFKFISDSLKTNTSKKSINLDKVLDGGPGKDGIPAINNPKFLSISESEKNLDFLTSKSHGLSIEIEGKSKFYPYDILVRHEIVNDKIGNTKFAVTFCPLCGSGIAFERIVSSREVKFGVSGKLYESNMLMYDNLTETLWSQSLGEGVVGDYTGTKLKHIKSNLLTFEQFKNKYPTGEVLSDDTGFSRNYGVVPYGDYDFSDDLYFPVSNTDDRIALKEIMYIVNNSGESLAFVLQDLVRQGEAELKVGENIYKAIYKDGLVDVSLDGEIIPGYYEMWFSWANHNEGSKNVWKK